MPLPKNANARHDWRKLASYAAGAHGVLTLGLERTAKSQNGQFFSLTFMEENSSAERGQGSRQLARRVRSREPANNNDLREVLATTWRQVLAATLLRHSEQESVLLPQRGRTSAPLRTGYLRLSPHALSITANCRSPRAASSTLPLDRSSNSSATRRVTCRRASAATLGNDSERRSSWGQCDA